MEWDSAVVGIRGNVYNWLSFGIVGNSVCRTWESCTFAFPCAVNRVIHDEIAIILCFRILFTHHAVRHILYQTCVIMLIRTDAVRQLIMKPPTFAIALFQPAGSDTIPSRLPQSCTRVSCCPCI